ncbi:MAG TPA: hypothetical protein VHR45_11555 [Thermoanaerobaculia bacterium]|nr:hypothetical protein [Thermoanaerobaculia bacterium]
MTTRSFGWVLVLALLAISALPAGAQAQGSRLHAGKISGPPATRQSFNCLEDAFTMCLNGGRFEVVAAFDANTGASGDAKMVRLTNDSGYMWFFGSSNIEAVVKVINGCGVDNNYWFFAGGLTNVHTVITVTDSITGAGVQYENPQNRPFQPIQDTRALAVCP